MRGFRNAPGGGGPLAAAMLLFGCLAGASDWPTQSWPESTPEEQGVDLAVLEQADQFIRANCPTRNSLLVVRNGYLVFERYYRGTGRYTLTNIASASKSFISALIGIAVERGLIQLDQRLEEFYPECFNSSTDPLKREITVRHLLTMTAGFQWDDFGPEMTAMQRSSNWHQSAINAPMASRPGERFNYNTALTHLLSGIITRSSGMSTLEFAQQHLFGTLGIQTIFWRRDAQGYYLGGWETYMLPQDLAKFGYLFLRKGNWDGRQVISSEWVKESTTRKVDNRAAERRSTNNIVSNIGDYGYLWWIKRMSGHDVFFASGYGGQLIFVVPELDLVAVTTGDTNVPMVDALRVHDRAVEAFWDYVLLAVKTRRPSLAEGGVVNAASNQGPIAPDSFAAIYGRDFTIASATWDSAITDDGRLPTELGGVRVRIGGRECFPYYVSPAQLNVLLPPEAPLGEVEVEVTNAQGSASGTAKVARVSPALFTWNHEGRQYPAAVFANEAVWVGPAGALPGVASRPAKPGDIVQLYATGLGPTAQAHPAGQVLTGALPLADPSSIRVRIGGAIATLYSVAMTYAGVYQLNAQVPAGAASGDQPVEIEASGVPSAAGTVIPIEGILR